LHLELHLAIDRRQRLLKKHLTDMHALAEMHFTSNAAKTAVALHWQGQFDDPNALVPTHMFLRTSFVKITYDLHIPNPVIY
jgi:hypothetical protein